MTFNDCGNFRDDWVLLKVNPATPCVFTRGIDQLELPVRHGEGKFYSDESTIGRLIKNNQVVVQYAMPNGSPALGRFPYNPNGSAHDIAGICDPSGRIFGLPGYVIPAAEFSVLCPIQKHLTTIPTILTGHGPKKI
jgi:phosphoribosylformylglycinamidine synthase